MSPKELQSTFFRKIKEVLPPHTALVDEIARHLNTSADSAYRRIRGQKELTFNEIGILAEQYRISLDQLLNSGTTSEAFVFSGKFVSREHADIEGYLKGLVKQLEYFNSFSRREMTYLNKDVPIFHHFMFPGLAAFKCYFWSRYNLNYPEYDKRIFSFDIYSEDFQHAAKKITELYIKLPSIEVWNLDCINLTIHQIEYCKHSNVFANQEDYHEVYAQLNKLVDHIELQVEEGMKFAYGETPQKGNAKYQVFINDFVMGDNTVILELDNMKLVSVNHNVINYMMTANEPFVKYTCDTVQHVIKKSSLISEVGEKERRLFFQKLRDKIKSRQTSLATFN